MLISHTNSGELAQTWTQFHAAAAETHLRDMISQMERSGDTTWEAIYRGILTQVSVGANDPVASGRSPLSAPGHSSGNDVRVAIVSRPTASRRLKPADTDI